MLAVRSADAAERARALDTVVRAYWQPAFRYLRAKWRTEPERAEDLTQGFFAAALEKGWLERFDPARGRFRTFLLSCLDAHAANELRAARRLKRGGGLATVPIEEQDQEGNLHELPLAGPADLEADFQREWARSLFQLSVQGLEERCRAEGRELAFTLFQRYDVEGSDALERPSYAGLAADLGISASQVTNQLHWVRKELRAIVLDRLRELTASEAEFRAEAQALLGLDLP